jgi:hypothetical protein
MLALGLKDRAQMSIRFALGASRGRLVRKVLETFRLLFSCRRISCTAGQ